MRAFVAVAIIAGVASADGHAMPAMGCDPMPMNGTMYSPSMDGMDQGERIKAVQDLIDVFCGGYDLPKGMDHDSMHHDPMSHGGMHNSTDWGSGHMGGSGHMSCGGMGSEMWCGSHSMGCGGMSCGGMWSSGDMHCGEMYHSPNGTEQLCKQAQMMLNALTTYTSTGKTQGEFFD